MTYSESSNTFYVNIPDLTHFQRNLVVKLTKDKVKNGTKRNNKMRIKSVHGEASGRLMQASFTDEALVDTEDDRWKDLAWLCRTIGQKLASALPPQKLDPTLVQNKNSIIDISDIQI